MPFDVRDVASAVASAFAGNGVGASGAASRLWGEAQEFAGRLLGAATERWLPFYLTRSPCHVRELRSGVAFQCNASGILICGACMRPACINHAQVDSHGNGTCYACISELIQQKRGAAAPPPGPAAGRTPPPQDPRAERVREAFKELELEPTANWHDVRARHRKLAAKNHPDRVRTPAAKAKAAERSVKINAAFAELKRHFEEKAA